MAETSKRLTLRGFIVSDLFAGRAAALEELRGWVESGRLAGENIGKRMVKVG